MPKSIVQEPEIVERALAKCYALLLKTGMQEEERSDHPDHHFDPLDPVHVCVGTEGQQSGDVKE